MKDLETCFHKIILIYCLASKYTALKPITISRTFRSTSISVLSYNHSWKSIQNNLTTLHSTNKCGSVSICSLQNTQTSLSTMFHWNSFFLCCCNEMQYFELHYTENWVHVWDLYIHLKLFCHSPSGKNPVNHSFHYRSPLGVMLLYDCSIKSLIFTDVQWLKQYYSKSEHLYEYHILAENHSDSIYQLFR